MKKHSDTIIINGKHFNARTGHALDSTDMSATKSRNLDGILPQHVKPVILDSPWTHQPIKSDLKKPVMDIVRTAAPHTSKRRAQPGQTLMRSGLKKPQPTLKRTTKVLSANPKKAEIKIANLTIKMSATAVDDKKLSHAQLVQRSANVRRFTPLSHVQPSTVSLNSVTSKRQQVSAAAILPQAPTTSLDIFERALAEANSHEQITPHHVNKTLKKTGGLGRTRRLVASSLALLIVAGFIGYQNIPTVKFKYASSKAGFQAELPDYRPSGFSVGKLSYETGAVRINFDSNSDDRTFSITQQPSNWDNDALRENYLGVNNLTYEVVNTADLVLYTYGNNNATWMNGGVWFDLKTEGSLTDRQINQIATSL